MKHASIVPLIGGETLGQMAAFGTKPDYLLSYSPFSNNDSHLVNYLKDVPYILLDQGAKHPGYVDIVNAILCSAYKKLVRLVVKVSVCNIFHAVDRIFVFEFESIFYFINFSNFWFYSGFCASFGW